MFKARISKQMPFLAMLARELPKVASNICFYAAKRVAEETETKFPVKVTGITARSIKPKKYGNGYLVGVRAKFLENRRTSYLGRVQKKWNYLRVMKHEAKSPVILKIAEGVMAKASKEAGFED